MDIHRAERGFDHRVQLDASRRNTAFFLQPQDDFMHTVKLRCRFRFRQHDAIHAGPHGIGEVGIHKRLVDPDVDRSATLVRFLYRFTNQRAAALLFRRRDGIFYIKDVDVPSSRPCFVNEARIGGGNEHRAAGDSVIHCVNSSENNLYFSL